MIKGKQKHLPDNSLLLPPEMIIRAEYEITAQ